MALTHVANMRVRFNTILYFIMASINYFHMTSLAINEAGTLIATTERGALCLYDGTWRRGHVDHFPVAFQACLCIVKRGDVETLLVADEKNGIVEFTIAGHRLRTLLPPPGSTPLGIAYSDNVIALSQYWEGEIRLLDYASGTVIRTIGSGLAEPMGLRFTADGTSIVVTENGGDQCVRKVDVATGRFLSRAAGLLENGIRRPQDLLVAKDGDGIVVVCTGRSDHVFGTSMLKLVFVDKAGQTRRVVLTPGRRATLAWLGEDVCCASDEGIVIIPPSGDIFAAPL